MIPIFASWVGLKLSMRPPNKRFPYGYYKAESLAFLFISLFLLFAAVELFSEAYQEWVNPSHTEYDLLLLSVPLISVGVSVFIYIYERKGAKLSNSNSLDANATETLSDIVSSLAIFLGLFMANLGLMDITPLLVFAIGLLIFKTGLENLRDAFYSLMDVAPVPVDQVSKSILEVDGVKGVKDVRIRKAGPMIFGEGTVLIPKTVDMVRAHELSERIGTLLKDRFNIERFTVHYEPYRGERVTLVLPVNRRGKEVKRLLIANHFGRARYLALLRVNENGKVLRHRIISNPYLTRKVRAGLATSKLVERYHPDVVLVRNIGEISFHTLRDALIEVHQVPDGTETVGRAVESYLNGETRLLENPTVIKVK